ncbi:MAG TPA: ComEA family DNA-binding protein, partial [Lachnospiraceae bacterium]|nr:ComEA family DNA-binding protein [Lachnospiraceae bacterium]
VPTGEEIENLSDNASMTTAVVQEEASASSLVNINTASRDELMTLPGIGEAKAGNIIRYREEAGSFREIEDIMLVEGIKTGLFNKIKEYICTGL